jgi:hypothetical protein
MRKISSAGPFMRLFLGLAVSAGAAAICIAPALAAPHGGGGMGGGMGGFGGASVSHIGAEGMSSSNGPNSDDRDFGRDRSSDVASSHASDTAVTVSNGVKASNRAHGPARAALRSHRHHHHS